MDSPVVGLLDEHASEEADNLPSWWRELPDDYERVDEWITYARNVLDGGPDDEEEALRVLAMGRQIEGHSPKTWSSTSGS